MRAHVCVCACVHVCVCVCMCVCVVWLGQCVPSLHTAFCNMSTSPLHAHHHSAPHANHTHVPSLKAFMQHQQWTTVRLHTSLCLLSTYISNLLLFTSLSAIMQNEHYWETVKYHTLPSAGIRQQVIEICRTTIGT